MRLVSNPFNDLLRLQSELDNLLNRPAPGYQLGASGAGGVFPPVNVFRNPEGVVIRAELPGLKPEDITVSSERRVSGSCLIESDRGRRGSACRLSASHFSRVCCSWRASRSWRISVSRRGPTSRRIQS